MKKYNACNLNVVKVDTGDDIRYLICKYNRITDTYIEIFTKSKFRIQNLDNSCKIGPLSKYYPTWSISNHKKKPSLMLSSREILEKYIEINPRNSDLDVDDLKVIEKVNGYNIHYAICKYDELTGAYIDVLTDGRFIMVDESCVEPLSKYYGPYGKIQKRALLQLYIDMNYKLDREEKKGQWDEASLERATLNLFAGDGHYDYRDCKIKSQRTPLQYLPCHLRDDEWLAKMLSKIDHNLHACNQMSALKDYDTALDFVKKSQLFQEKRHEYELKIVKWQINNMEKNLGDWYPGEYDQWSVYKPSCDLKFRELLVESLTRIGMDKEVIEEGIEKYADLWREELMNRAFLCEYDLPLPYPYTKNEPDPDEEEYKEKWLKLRRYEYYQRHKKSVDLYGEASSDMLISEEEAQELKKYLDKRNAERKRRIEELKAPKIIPYQKRKSLQKNIKYSA